MATLKGRAVWILAVGLGVLGTLLVQTVSGTVLAQTRAAVQPLAPTATRDGRFQIIFSPSGMRADTFLLDTQTGHVWRPTQFDDLVGEPSVWKFQDRVDNDQQLLAWAASFRSKTQ